MKRFIVIIFTTLVVFVISLSNETIKNQSPSPVLNQYIEQMVASFSVDDCETMIRKLVDFGSRNATKPGNVKACEWARDQFKAWGLDSVYLDKFSNSYGPNVVAVKYGEKEVQDSIFITGGHIDCMPSSDFSPGADDNASGSVAVLMAAKAMSKYKFRNETRFVLFNAEEYGLRGSNAYVDDHKNEKIKGVLVHDMCLWFKSGDIDWDIESQNGNKWLGAVLEKASEDYADLPAKVNSPSG